jgi:hypothetical protein
MFYSYLPTITLSQYDTNVDENSQIILIGSTQHTPCLPLVMSCPAFTEKQGLTGYLALGWGKTFLFFLS